MVIKTVNLETVCGITSSIPDSPYDEVAFAGKSNVGKSSLINALMNRKSLARTSSQPGKTQTINFYNVNDSMYLVDLPGYGYASAGVEIRAKWGQMIEHYLHASKKLKAVFLLIDIRHDPSENDRMMCEWITAQGFCPIIIATKADKLNRSRIESHVQAIRRVLQLAPEAVVIPFSSQTKQGRDEIWDKIEALVELPEAPAQNEQACMALQNRKAHDSAQAVKTEEGAQQERKARWKKTGRPVAKKTIKKAKQKAEKRRK